MPKDFQDLLSNPSNLSNPPTQKRTIDPNIIHNDVVAQEIRKKYQDFLSIELVGKIASMLVLAPLLTMQVSMQLSVLPHKEKYHDNILNEKRNLIKAPNQITVQDKRRYEMMIKSGVTESNMPFRAPVYSSYREAFRALSNQGFLGFYKGNLAGSIHMGMGFVFKRYLVTWFKFNDEEYFWKKSSSWIKLFLAIGLSSITDMITYPLMTMQSRFILQNRLPGFSVYKGFYHFYEKHRIRKWQFYQGWQGIIPYNFCLIFSMTNFFPNSLIKGVWLGHNIGALISYPLLTIMRRLQCQSNLPGMIPLRYGGVIHCFKLMMNEEGIKGLYRGFALNWILTNIGFVLTLYSQVYLSKSFYLKNVD